MEPHGRRHKRLTLFAASTLLLSHDGLLRGRRPSRRCSCLIALLAICAVAQAQSFTGEIVSKDAAARSLTLKTESGETATIQLDKKARILRARPGRTDASKASSTTFDLIAIGERVTTTGPATKTVRILLYPSAPATRPAVAATNITSGVVTAVNPMARELTIEVPAPDSTKSIVVGTTPATTYRRLSRASLRSADAQPGKLEEIAIGDLVRIEGEPAGTNRLNAAAITSGAFRRVAGTVSAAQAGSITIDDSVSRQHTIVKLASQPVVLHRGQPLKPSSIAPGMQVVVVLSGDTALALFAGPDIASDPALDILPVTP